MIESKSRWQVLINRKRKLWWHPAVKRRDQQNDTFVRSHNLDVCVETAIKTTVMSRRAEWVHNLHTYTYECIFEAAYKIDCRVQQYILGVHQGVKQPRIRRRFPRFAHTWLSPQSKAACNPTPIKFLRLFENVRERDRETSRTNDICVNSKCLIEWRTKSCLARENADRTAEHWKSPAE